MHSFYQRSVFGQIHVFNRLPSRVVSLPTTSEFQTALTSFIRERIHVSPMWFNFAFLAPHRTRFRTDFSLIPVSFYDLLSVSVRLRTSLREYVSGILLSSCWLIPIMVFASLRVWILSAILHEYFRSIL